MTIPQFPPDFTACDYRRRRDDTPPMSDRKRAVLMLLAAFGSYGLFVAAAWWLS